MNIQKFSLQQIHGMFAHCIRTLPGYKDYDREHEPNSLIDFDRTHENYNIIVHPCLDYVHNIPEKRFVKNGEPLAELYKNVTGKAPRCGSNEKNSTKAGSIVVTLPEDVPVEKSEEFFVKMTEVLIEVLGIRREDVLYAAVHMDESRPHMHFAFMPFYKKENGEMGCSMKRYGPEFYKSFHPRCETMMKEKGLPCSLLLNDEERARRPRFDVSKMTAEQRRESLSLKKEIDENQSDLSALTEQNAVLKEKLEVLEAEKESLEAEKDELESELIEARQKVAALKETAKKLKKEIKSIVQWVNQIIPSIVSYFVSLWKEAKSKAEKEMLEVIAQAEAQAQAEKATGGLKAIAAEAEALVVEEKVKGIDMATFTRTEQKVGFATKQILKAAEAAGQADALRESPDLMAKALDAWFNRAEAEASLKGLSEARAKEWMNPAERARRALEEALKGAIEQAEEVENELWL